MQCFVCGKNIEITGKEMSYFILDMMFWGYDLEALVHGFRKLEKVAALCKECYDALGGSRKGKKTVD